MSSEQKLFHLHKASSLQNEDAPLLILLHGYGSNEQELLSFAGELDDKYTILSLRAPYFLDFGGYAWFNIDFTSEGIKIYDEEEIQTSLKRVIDFIKEAKNEFKVGKQKVVLAGFSQGAILSHLIALSYPELVDGVLAMSGFIRQNSLLTVAPKEDLTDLNIFITHGTQDMVIPIQQARESKAFLSKIGLNYKYKEYPMAHGISPECLEDIIHWSSSIIN